MNLKRIYTKKRGMKPDFSEPIIMRSFATIEDVCSGVHRDLIDEFKYSLVWGTSAKHIPQRVGLNHILQDEDVVEIHT